MTLDNRMTYHTVIILDYKNKTTEWKSLIIKRSGVYCCKLSYTHQTSQKKSTVHSPPQTVFKRVYTVYTYSNCMISQLLYC